MQVHIDRLATGGDGVGRVDGKVVFVRGGLPGDVVELDITQRGKRFDRGRVTRVIEPGAHRVTPHCELSPSVCGGCPLGALEGKEQRNQKEQMVHDARERIARIDEFPVQWSEAGEALGHRIIARGVVENGQFGFYRPKSHEVVPVPHCPMLAPAVNEELSDVPAEVQGIAQVRTNERGDIGWSAADRCDPPLQITVDGVSFRVSSESFFQTRLDGASQLRAAVRAAVPSGSRMLDIGAGVGLLSAGLDVESCTLIESNPVAASDARHNVPGAEILVESFETDRTIPADAVVADPPRAGLGFRGARMIGRTGADTVVVVSCDLGAFGRDIGLLVAEGFVPIHATLIDMFPHTAHVEIVTHLERA